ncbi:hypothetical protein GF324_13530 [bacterium]|nr:hypothetical protein [bacterium]
MSFDALELVSTGVGAVAWIFMLKEDDNAKLWELIGSMSIVAIMGANPFLGLAAIAAAAYSMIRDKKARVLPISLGKGAITAGIGSALFLLMGFPFLVELVIVITVLTILRKHNRIGRDSIKTVLPWVKQKNQDLRSVTKGKGSSSVDQPYDSAPVRT